MVLHGHQHPPGNEPEPHDTDADMDIDAEAQNVAFHATLPIPLTPNMIQQLFCAFHQSQAHYHQQQINRLAHVHWESAYRTMANALRQNATTTDHHAQNILNTTAINIHDTLQG